MTKILDIKQKMLLGYLCVLGSSVAYGFMPLFASRAYAEGMSTFSVVFWRFFLTTIILFIYILAKKIPLNVEKKKIAFMFMIGALTHVTANITLFLSYRYMNVGLATSVHFIYPVLIVLYSTIFRKEKISKTKILALSCVLVGVAIISIRGTNKITTVGMILALTSAVFFAAYAVGLSSKLLQNVQSILVAFYVALGNTTAILVLVLWEGSFMPPSNTALVAVVSNAIIAGVIGTWMYITGIQIVGASNTAILSAFEPITAIFVGLYLGESLTPMLFIGIALILCASYLVVVKERTRKNSE